MGIMKFLRPKNELETGGRNSLPAQQAPPEPDVTCPNCHKTILVSKLRASYGVCPCGHHFRMSARNRLAMIAEEGSFTELFTDVKTNAIHVPSTNSRSKIDRSSSW